MKSPSRILAVCGWALLPEWFQEQVAASFPEAEVRAIYPSHPEDPEEARRLLSGPVPDLILGHSLGSLWLMAHREHLPPGSAKALLAPVLAFLKEPGLGGTTHETQLKYLIKVLKRNPQDDSPLLDFYAACRLPFPEHILSQAPDRETLIRGLEFLHHVTVAGTAADGFTALLGDDDPFLDGTELKRHIPHLEIVEGAGHAPGNLLTRLAEFCN